MPNLPIPLCATLLLLALSSTGALARDTKNDADDDTENNGPVHVKVPAKLRGKGFAARLGDQRYQLNTDEIVVPANEKRQRLELSSADGRLLDVAKVPVDADLLTRVSPSSWRAGANFGTVTVVNSNGNSLRPLLQDKFLDEASLDAIYQPSAFGLALSFASLESSYERIAGLTSTYRALQSRIAAAYEIAPLARAQNWLHRTHLIAYLGAHYTRHALEISDSVVTLRDTATTFGPYSALDLLYPFGNFSLSARTYYTYQEIEFKHLDVKSKTVQQGFLFGGSYAF